MIKGGRGWKAYLVLVTKQKRTKQRTLNGGFVSENREKAITNATH